MASILGYINLFQQVASRFAGDGTPCQNAFGWRVPAQHPMTNRIAWVPGDTSGAFGTSAPTRNPGGYPRSLGTTLELFTIVIFGQDATAPEDEMAQYRIVRLLYDAWYRAVYRAAHGAFQVRLGPWEIQRVERRYGAALRVSLELQTTIPDLPFSEIPDWADINDASASTVVILGPLGEPGALVEPLPVVPPPQGETSANKNMPGLTTTADGDLAVAATVTYQPAPTIYTVVSVNGLFIDDLGNGTRTAASGYFSGDGGTTARRLNQVMQGDRFYWQGSIAGYELAPSDSVSFWYQVQGSL